MLKFQAFKNIQGAKSNVVAIAKFSQHKHMGLEN
jgi:hypothetical protein